MMMSSGGDVQYFWRPPPPPPPPPAPPHSEEDHHHRYYYMSSVSSAISYTSSASSNSSSNSSSSNSSPPHLPFSNPDPSAILPTTWVVAEDAAHAILTRFHPTTDSQQKRKDVTDYLQNLFRSIMKCEVVPYGSVPLRTYLPDGDIDLTALSNVKENDVMASDFRAVLEREKLNGAAQYQIQDVQFIVAEVKLVKCLIQNIVVDISFNQLGGISTLCFLEQVDRFIGRDHLFKRSIILIKAWCYYESRILGAHHGLISTYALEMLVLYIFHMFHLSIDGPLAALYRFLDYFGKFDWDNYCISLNGPVPRAALPDVLVDISDNGWNDMLLNAEFLKNWVDVFSVPSKDTETNLRAFAIKHLNIIDPLKVNNNLGRSVNRGNFYRIRSALRFGARKLGWVLSLPSDRLANELKKFFSNSLERHEGKYWDYIPATLFPLGAEDSGTSSFTPSSEGNMNSIFGFGDDENSGTDDDISKGKENLDCFSTKFAASNAKSNFEDDYDLTYSDYINAGGAYSMSDYSAATCDTDLSSHSLDHCSSPKETDMMEKGFRCQDNMIRPAIISKGKSSLPTEDIPAFICNNHEDGFADSHDEFNSLLDLTGDHCNHVRGLLYGLTCHGYTPAVSRGTDSFRALPRARNRYQNEKINQSLRTLSQRRTTGISPRMPPSSSAGIHSTEKPNPRGTGTFFPNMHHRADKDNASTSNVMNPRGHQALSADSYRGRDTNIQGMVTLDENDHWLSEAHFPALSDVKSGSHPPSTDSSVKNPFSLSPDKLEFGSFKRWPSLGSSSDKGKQKLTDPLRITTCGSDPDGVEDTAGGACCSTSANLRSDVGQAFEPEDTNEFPPVSM